MTPIQNVHLELYILVLTGFLYFWGFEKKPEKGESGWAFMSMLKVMMAVLASDMTIWIVESIKKPQLIFFYKLMWTINYVSLLLLLYLYILYMHTYLKEKFDISSPYPKRYYALVGSLSILFWMMSFRTDWMFYIGPDYEVDYHYTYLFSCIVVLLILLPGLVIIMRHRMNIDRHTKVTFGLYIVIPIFALGLEFVVGVDTSFNIALGLSLLMIYVSINQKNRMIAYEQRMEVQKKANELRETEQKVMVGNIQPLFIQSVLASIADMATKDPGKAGETTTSFASYLRMNLQSVGKNQPVPFEEELKHAESYLELEKNVWPGKINVEYDTEAFNFFLPVLTLQPIVENALVHGIIPNGGGTIKIWSKEDGDNFLVGIEDDGVGFDSTLVSDGIGISNTRSRIKKICRGSIKVDSEKDKGTRVVLTIPRTTNMTF
ncbi:MAG: sensor histidine kinase [Candidatus Ornithospirochaeta sp.]